MKVSDHTELTRVFTLIELFVVTAIGARLRGFTRSLAPLLARRTTYIVMGFGILLLDLVTGPLLMTSILFVLPVGLSAWFCGPRLAYVLALLLPFGRLLIAVFLDAPAIIVADIANALIRVAVLSSLAFFATHSVRQSREIKVLHGLLPICMWCKSIRNEDGSWQKLETYIHQHSDADFTHGLCPECKQERYGDLFDKKQNAQFRWQRSVVAQPSSVAIVKFGGRPSCSLTHARARVRLRPSISTTERSFPAEQKTVVLWPKKNSARF